MKVVGKLIKRTKVKEYGSNGFRKREIVLVTDEQYPQTILIEFHQDNCSKVDGFKKDDILSVDINLRGREWTNAEGKTMYFNSLVGWRVEQITQHQPDPSVSMEVNGMDDDDDDLPF